MCAPFLKEVVMAYTAQTAVDICNKALDKLGQRADIGNIETPTTDNEKVCARWYYDTLDYLLRRYVWNFAIKRAAIPRDLLNTPEFDFTDAYELPSDFVRLLAINGREDLNNLDYDLAGGYLLLNAESEDSCKLKYISRVTDVKKFDSGFKQLLTLYLAANLSFRFTQKQTVMERLYKEIELEEAKIVSIDGQERPPKRIQYSQYRRARKRNSRDFYGYRPVKWADDKEEET